MQPLGLTATQNAAYLTRLFGSHDYRIDVDVLDLNERPTGTVVFLDGQIDIQDPTTLVRRTASLAVSDVNGALDFTGGSTWSGSTVWVDRLVRIRHTIHVPELGRDITVVPFIGPPSTISRDGADVTLELQDKAALATRGASPYTAPKGMNAVAAIRTILARCTGEFRFRLGTTTKRLSKPYAVGWSDDAAPWLVAQAIAGNELGSHLLYSCDGYATLRRKPTTVGLVVPHVTSPPQDGVDFTTLSNWVMVTGKQASKTTSTATITTQPVATAVVSSGNITPAALSRKGVARYLPLLVDMSDATKTTQVKARANSALAAVSRLQAQPALTCVPFFHADVDDLISYHTPGGDLVGPLATGSIPLGADEMQVGTTDLVSKSLHERVHASTVRTVKRKK